MQFCCISLKIATLKQRQLKHVQVDFVLSFLHSFTYSVDFFTTTNGGMKIKQVLQSTFDRIATTFSVRGKIIGLEGRGEGGLHFDMKTFLKTGWLCITVTQKIID